MLRTNTRNHAKFHCCRPNGVREKHYQKFVTPKSTKYPTILPCGGIITQHAYMNTGSTCISSEIFTNCFAAHHIISLSPTSVRTHILLHGITKTWPCNPSCTGHLCVPSSNLVLSMDGGVARSPCGA